MTGKSEGGRKKLTKTAVEAILLPATGYTLTYDAEVRGLAVRVTSTGVRSYVFEVRINYRTRRMTIGRHGAITAEQARTEAKRLAGKVAGGADPVTEKRQRKAGLLSLGQAWDAYLEARTLKPRTRADMERALKVYFPDWRRTPVASLTRDMVGARHKRIGQRSKAQANLAMRYLRAVLNWAAEEYADKDGKPLLAHNPVSKIGKTKSWYKVERRKNSVKPDQFAAWMAAVQALPDVPEREPGTGKETPRLRNGEMLRDFLLTLVLTGLRRSEAFGLKWVDVNLVSRTFVVRDTKNGTDHELPITGYLADLLSRLRERSGPEYVFSDEAGKRLSNFRVGLARVREQCGFEFTFHDLRRTFATAAGGIAPAYVVKRLMNHAAAGDVTADYVQFDTEGLRPFMTQITAHLLGAAGIKAAEADNVVPFARRA